MSTDLTIIKAGTGVLTKTSDGTIDRAALVHLVAAISGLINTGHRCLFVSSGAVGSGVSALGLSEYPKDIETRQACAAVGQARLMSTYSNLFSNFEITVAQILLTAEDIQNEGRAANLLATGEILGQYAAADIRTGTLEIGDGVYTIAKIPEPKETESESAATEKSETSTEEKTD